MSCIFRDSESIGYAERDQWLKGRSEGVGGSDVAAILGMSPSRSPRDVWLDKLGRGSDQPTTWAMHRGVALEAPLIAWFQRASRVTVHTDCFALQRNCARPWMLASLDGWISNDHLVEVKTASWRMSDHWADGQVSDYAELQTQWYMAVTGATRVTVIAAIGDDDPEYRDVTRDQGLITTLITACERFWAEYVQPGVEPPLMWVDRDVLAKELRDKAIEGTAAIGGQEDESWLTRRAKAVADIKAAEQSKAEAEAHLLATLDAADHLVIDGKVAATYKQQATRRISVDLLRHNGIDLDEYKTATISRVLRIPAKRKAWHG